MGAKSCLFRIRVEPFASRTGARVKTPFGPRAGQKVLTVQGVMPRDADFKQTLCADSNGFSLHAAVRCGADDRQALEQLCRYITRPALADERVETNAAGQVVLKLKIPWRDGTTHLMMSPLEFMQRLAALVPPPRLHRPITASRLSISTAMHPVWVASSPPPARLGWRKAVVAGPRTAH